jgi:hypothetical protein
MQPPLKKVWDVGAKHGLAADFAWVELASRANHYTNFAHWTNSFDPSAASRELSAGGSR